MRITCPSCHATYEVPDALVGAAARKVRCARCAFEWLPEPMATAPPPEPPPRPRPEPRAERPLRAEPLPPLPPPERVPTSSLRARPAPMLASIAVLAISMVVLISLGWAAYAWRAEVMQAWPPSQRLFAALGLA